MNWAFGARRFVLPIGAFLESCGGIVEKFAAFFTRHTVGIAMVRRAVDLHHSGDGQ
jgi:hypothetical protein